MDSAGYLILEIFTLDHQGIIVSATLRTAEGHDWNQSLKNADTTEDAIECALDAARDHLRTMLLPPTEDADHAL